MLEWKQTMKRSFNKLKKMVGCSKRRQNQIKIQMWRLG